MKLGERWKRGLKLAAALALLAGLYLYCDWRRVVAALVDLDGWHLGWAMLLFVPQTLVSARRWQILTAPLFPVSLGESLRQTLIASAWNLIAPSKLGDLSKVGMLPLKGPTQRGAALVLVVMERAGDVVALALLWLLGAALVGISPWLVLCLSMLMLFVLLLLLLHAAVRNPKFLLLSLSLWLLHLVQIDLMLRSAGVVVPFDVSLARIPAAIFAGLLPISLWGIGTRDGALIWLYSDVAPAATMAAVGLLTATRYLIPGAAGILVLLRSDKRPACGNRQTGEPPAATVAAFNTP